MLPVKEDYRDVYLLFPGYYHDKVRGHLVTTDDVLDRACGLCDHSKKIAALLSWGCCGADALCVMCFLRLKVTFDHLGWPNMCNSKYILAKYYLASLTDVTVNPLRLKQTCSICGLDDGRHSIKISGGHWLILCQICIVRLNTVYDLTIESEQRDWSHKLLIVRQSNVGCELHRDIFHAICVVWSNITHFGKIAAANYGQPQLTLE